METWFTLDWSQLYFWKEQTECRANVFHNWLSTITFLKRELEENVVHIGSITMATLKKRECSVKKDKVHVWLIAIRLHSTAVFFATFYKDGKCVACNFYHTVSPFQAGGKRVWIKELSLSPVGCGNNSGKLPMATTGIVTPLYTSGFDYSLSTLMCRSLSHTILNQSWVSVPCLYNVRCWVPCLYHVGCWVPCPYHVFTSSPGLCPAAGPPRWPSASFIAFR